ncbi:MAG: hypothetical protein HQ596_04390 [Candidatus Saganbacteria bacterium]|nr:hypothetical protein [Candidatus Saganbacteria bacterium]
MSRVGEATLKLLYGRRLSSQDRKLIKTQSTRVKERLERYRFSEYENWGVQFLAGVRPWGYEELEDSAVCGRLVDTHLSEWNWRYRLFGEEEKARFYERLFSVRYQVLIPSIARFISEKYGDYPIAGLSIMGGFLYGHERQIPDDLDFMLLLEGAPFTANPLTMYLDDMEQRIFVADAPRKVSSGKVGLTIIGTENIHARNQEENVKGFVITFWGQCVPIIGSAFSAGPPPIAANIPFAYRTMAWGYKDILMNPTDVSTIIRSLSRVVFNATLAEFMVQKLGLDLELQLAATEIWETIYRDVNPEVLISLYVKLSRALAGDFFQIECMVKAQATQRLEEVLA